MEDRTRTGNNVIWITNGIVQIISFDTADGPNFHTTCANILAPRRIVFSSVCDWNLIMTVGYNPYNGQCYAINAAFNILFINELYLRSRWDFNLL
jgi:hypothetical protein